MPEKTYKAKVRTDNCRIAIIKYRLRTTDNCRIAVIKYRLGTTFCFCFACVFENLAQAIPVPWSPT